MSREFGIVEIGSINVKAYKCNWDTVTELGFRTIDFKRNFSKSDGIVVSDIESLSQFINSAFTTETEVHIYTTGVFRNLSPQKVSEFEDELRRKIQFTTFEVVSAECENRFTVYGAIRNVPLEDNICVFIGGGASTEISICHNGGIVEMANSEIGVADIAKVYPDLANPRATTSIDTVMGYLSAHMYFPINKAKYVILAGGDFLLRYENAKYPVKANTLFNSNTHPYIISYKTNRAFEDKYYHSISLDDLRKTTPDNPNWWDGTRAMCAFTSAVTLAVGAEIIIPTRVSMAHGITARLHS